MADRNGKWRPRELVDYEEESRRGGQTEQMPVEGYVGILRGLGLQFVSLRAIRTGFSTLESTPLTSPLHPETSLCGS
jgi:hypothetical protein